MSFCLLHCVLPFELKVRLYEALVRLVHVQVTVDDYLEVGAAPRLGLPEEALWGRADSWLPSPRTLRHRVQGATAFSTFALAGDRRSSYTCDFRLDGPRVHRAEVALRIGGFNKLSYVRCLVNGSWPVYFFPREQFGGDERTLVGPVDPRCLLQGTNRITLIYRVTPGVLALRRVSISEVALLVEP